MRRTRNYEDYPGDDGCTIVLNRFLDEQEAKHRMPSDKVVTVDMGDCLTIVNACFRTRVNETLGKIYGALLSARLGESIGVTADPYRIMLELPRYVDWNTVKETIVSVQPGTVEASVRLALAMRNKIADRGYKAFSFCEGNGMHLRREDGSLMLCHLQRLNG